MELIIINLQSTSNPLRIKLIERVRRNFNSTRAGDSSIFLDKYPIAIADRNNDNSSSNLGMENAKTIERRDFISIRGNDLLQEQFSRGTIEL